MCIYNLQKDIRRTIPMKHEINAFELSDEQLEAVSGGLGDTQLNGAVVAPLTVVNQSDVKKSAIGSTGTNQTNVDKNTVVPFFF
jgi:hypothetical protein